MIKTTTKIGEEIIYKLPVKASIVSIDSFTDVIVGNTIDRYFDKFFRYSIEGLFFNEYIALTNINLQTIITNIRESYLIEIKYIRAGTNNTGALTLDSVTVNSTAFITNNGYEYDHSNFKKFFESTDVEVLTWTQNVLNKIYFPGNLAKYIERNEKLLII